MIELLGAVIISALLGSLHCVGMCGPMAVLAMGRMSPHDATGDRVALWPRVVGYHLGRLTTYLVLGALAGSAALFINHGGLMFGIPRTASQLAGALLIGIGVWQLTLFWWPSLRRAPHGKWSLAVARWLASFRSVLMQLPSSARAYAIGGLTTLLPCGWLYIFVLVAAGTGSPSTATLVMGAFWLGTLPSLTAVATGFTKLGRSMGGVLPVLTAIMLIGTGCYTATGRAATNLAPLTARAAAVNERFHADEHRGVKTLKVLQSEPLPCCRHE